MGGTPRLRSAFPSTPQQGVNSPAQHASSLSSSRTSQFGSSPSKLPDITSLQPTKPDPDAPLIPLTTLDAPSQRFYVVAVYSAFFFYRLWDFYHLTLDETESLWLFMKWVAIDGVFLFGLPTFRIPWLEWSSATMTILFLLHAVFDGVLMFRIPIPFGAWLAALAKVLYNSEISVSERRVKPAKIQNPSLILGRQIINILPEGSAILNPNNVPLCINVSRYADTAILPIQINQTHPKSIELVRYDLTTSEPEIIILLQKEIKKLLSKALGKAHHDRQLSQPVTIHYAAKKTGLYKLASVVDETNSPVQMRSSQALVVACPSAEIVSYGDHRCRGDLSNVTMAVYGTAPLKVRYRKTVNQDDNVVSYQSIQPEDFISPLVKQRESTTLIPSDFVDLSWAASHRILVPLNESLMSSGDWTYSIEEVTDACGNVVPYKVANDLNQPKAGAPVSGESFHVHDRPKVSFSGFSVLRPLEVAAGREVQLPLLYSSTGKGPIPNTAYNLTYSFLPADQSGRPQAEQEPRYTNLTVKSIHEKHTVKEPGMYTLESIESEFCDGEVLEPAVCMLINPPMPELTYSSEAISDKCAGRPIGLRVSLDLVGTPPFKVSYSIQKSGDKAVSTGEELIAGSRGQIIFQPENAGRYTYRLTGIRDRHYTESRHLQGDAYTLQQDVKPSVSAHFINFMKDKTQACIDETVSFSVKLQGEGPWNLEYELVHGGKRTKYQRSDIQRELFTIETDPLVNGGDYSLALVSVKDAAGCKELLQEEARIYVRQQKPKVSFGVIEGKREVHILDGKQVDLPLRFQGIPPWTVEYTNGVGVAQKKIIQKANDFLRATTPGTYSLTKVDDNSCPGLVDKSAYTFNVQTIGRPSIRLAENPLLEGKGNDFTRKAVCEGEEDALDIFFEGTPPFDVKYQEHFDPKHGAKSVRGKEMNIPLHSAQIKMDTSKAGSYRYEFIELGDYNYDHEATHKMVTIHQIVNSKPIASFEFPGKVYSFCQGREGGLGDGVIPMKFTGLPPFTVDLELKHSNKNSGPPVTITKSNILNSTYDLRIPHSYLQPGNSVLVIRRVRDARGCERQLDFPSPSSPSSAPSANLPRVQISVHDPPVISPADIHKTHYCVGERLSFALSGLAPFSVFYHFEGKDRKAVVNSPVFRRIAESPGNFTITAISDAASDCPGGVSLDTKTIHPLPSVKVSHGRESRIDIHAGGEAEILFEFGGTPPFEFTYTRSENARGKREGGKGGRVLETKTLRSEEKEMRVKASEEGTYEVVAIRDRWCSFARPGVEGLKGVGGGGLGLELGQGQGQGLLMDD